MTANVGVTTNAVKKPRHPIAVPSDSSVIDAESMTDIGKRLDQLRKRLGWTWRRFSTECGFTPTHMSTMVERGNMTAESLKRIRERTRVNLNWLVCEEEEMGVHLTADQQAESIERRTRRRPPPSDPPSKPPTR
jgi:transcriptional regulator with XRE-family HTH domain